MIYSPRALCRTDFSGTNSLPHPPTLELSGVVATGGTILGKIAAPVAILASGGGHTLARRLRCEISAGLCSNDSPMNNFENWPLWLQLVIAIPNAIIMTLLLWIWWRRKKRMFTAFP